PRSEASGAILGAADWPWMPLKIVARIGAVERFVAEREIGDDVALDDRFQQRPLEPGRIAQVTARDVAVVVEPQPDENVAAEPFDDRHAFTAATRDVDARWTLRRLRHDLLDERKRLFHLANANPDPRIDVALVTQRHLERKAIVRPIGKRTAC